MRSFISKGLQRLMASRRPIDAYPHGDRHATITAIATVKGGVGKTTTAVNLAAALVHETRRRVLLVDLDAQGHCSTCLAEGLDPTARARLSTSELLLGEPGHAELLDAVVPSGIDGLDLTPADPELAETDGRLSQRIGKELLLRDALRVTRSHYDHILIDCPPNLGNLTLNALLAADYALIPADLSALALQGAEELIATLITLQQRLGRAADLLGILLTRFDARNASTNRPLLRDLRESWGEHLFDTRIGVNVDIARAQLAGLPVTLHAPSSRGAQHYRSLASELDRRLESYERAA